MIQGMIDAKAHEGLVRLTIYNEDGRRMLSIDLPPEVARKHAFNCTVASIHAEEGMEDK